MTENDRALSGFLRSVEADFDDYLESNPDLCEIPDLFTDDYDKMHVEQLYLLRYVYAYALENTLMYKWVLEDRKSAANLTVESIGCGSLVDAWGLKHAADTLGMATDGIVHTGVDLADWHYKFDSLESTFIHGDAGAYFNEKQSLNSDVYIFPRSIGDFPEKVFYKIRDAFKFKPITKPVIYLMISQIRSPGSLEVKSRDSQRTAELMQVLLQRDFDEFRLACEDDYTEEKLRDHDNLFNYPIGLYKKLVNLHDWCINVGNRDICGGCPMDRSPMLGMKHFSYNVFKFERKAK